MGAGLPRRREGKTGADLSPDERGAKRYFLPLAGENREGACDVPSHGRLEAGKGKIEGGAFHPGPGKRNGVGISFPREPVDGRTARVAEPKQGRHLVERLAGRVVPSPPQQPGPPGPFTS